METTTIGGLFLLGLILVGQFIAGLAVFIEVLLFIQEKLLEKISDGQVEGNLEKFKENMDRIKELKTKFEDDPNSMTIEDQKELAELSIDTQDMKAEIMSETKVLEALHNFKGELTERMKGTFFKYFLSVIAVIVVVTLIQAFF